MGYLNEHKLKIRSALMKRILYLSRSGEIGGSQRQLYYLLTSLPKRYEPIVVCTGNGPFFNRLQDHNISTHVLPMHPWRKFPAGLCRYWDAEHLAAFAKKSEVALVHCSDLWLSQYMIWVARRLKIPSVLHVRTPLTINDARKHRCHKATAIIAISRRIRRNLLRAGIAPERITRIHDSVDLSLFMPADATQTVLRKQYSPSGNVLVAIVGRIAPSKHQLEFLRAAAAVIRNCSESVTFFLIGHVRHPKYFKKLERVVSRNGLDKQVIFTGRRDDIPQVLNSLDILVTLAGGSVMFEAAACGKPVISAGFDGDASSSLNKYVRFRPIVIASNTSGLIESLIRLINDPALRRKIGQASRRWAETSFCHLAMAAKTQKVYEKLLV